MADYCTSLVGSLNQTQETNAALAGSLLCVQAGTPLVARLTVIDNGGRSYSTMEEFYADQGYEDEDDFLEQMGQPTMVLFLASRGLSDTDDFLRTQEYPTVSEVLENCGVHFGD